MKQKTGSIILFLSKAILFFSPLAVFFLGQRYFYEETLFWFKGNIVLLLIYAVILYMAINIYSGFGFGSIRLQEIIAAWIISLIIVNMLQYFFLSLMVERLLNLRGFAVMLLVQILLAVPLSIITRAIYYWVHPAQRTLIVFGDVKKLQLYKATIAKQPNKFKVTDTIYQHEHTGTLLDAINKVQAVFFLDVEESLQDGLLEYCYLNDKRSYVLPTFSRVLYNTAGTVWLSNTPVLSLKKPEPTTETLFIKRIIDIILSLIGIITTGPLMLIICIAVRMQDKHPAVYKQVRVTKNGREFKMYKFRSMVPDAEVDGVPRLTAKGDKRITPVGRILRRTRMDELPQLFNVLGGSMSIVGPRPERPEIAKKYQEIYPSFAFRTKVKAGMTGYAQVFGSYNTPPEEKLFLDIMYIETFSLWQDIKLMMQTVSVIFSKTSTEGIEKNATTAMK